MQSSNYRDYYSLRMSPQNAQIELGFLCECLTDINRDLEEKGYYVIPFGGVYQGWGYEATVSSYPKGYAKRKLHKDLWPVSENCQNYSEEDVLNVIEFIHEHIVSPGTDAEIAAHVAQEYFRNEINDLLRFYGSGYELSSEGKIISLVPTGLDDLLTYSLPRPTSVKASLINHAEALTQRFLNKKASLDDRKDVIKGLADVFEALKDNKVLQNVLNNQDEKAIFHIANKFSLRHNNQNQHEQYDRDTWYDWMFYFYLATLRTVLVLILREESKTNIPVQILAEGSFDVVLAELKKRSPTIFSIFRLAKVRFVNKDRIELAFKFMFHVKRINQPEIKASLEKVISEIFERPVEISAVLEAQDQTQ
ncbi:MAG TPA: hypothetical protein VHD60_00840 [Candidatus Saccharimonadales bacterium]|nr:hypothetical protein [Candidatus Saccharimonadales bacterium]